MHPVDLAHNSLNGVGEGKVDDQQETDSMSAMKDQDDKEKEGQDRGHDLVKQVNVNRIFNKESKMSIMAAKDALEANLIAAREEASQQENLWHAQSAMRSPTTKKCSQHLVQEA
jgi:outer membrane protein assembly factor BamE (lipoprotein component of BamABCDE complex)